MAPDYSEAAKEIKDAVFASINCAEFEDICSKYEIRGYPTMKVFQGGEKEPLSYDGGREKKDFVSFFNLFLGPAVTEINSASALDDFIKKNPVCIVAHAPSPSALSDEKLSIFKKVADQLKLKVRFGLVTFQEDREASPETSIYIESIFPNGRRRFEWELNSENLSKFVANAGIPAVDEVRSDNYKLYLDSGVPIGFVFYGDEENKKQLQPYLETLAADTFGHLNFAFIDGKRYKSYAVALGLKDSAEKPLQLPAFVAHNPHNELKYIFEGVISSGSAEFEKFLAEFKAGKIEPYLKSDPLPEDNTQPLKVVVNKNFNEIVMAEGKDVLVEFYSPNCGACTALEPSYVRLAAELANSNIVVAKMNAESNDLPLSVNVNIDSYPLIYLFPAADKKPILCERPYNFNSLVTFLKQKATNNTFDVKLDEKTAEEFKDEAVPEDEADADAEEEDAPEPEEENVDL